MVILKEFLTFSLFLLCGLLLSGCTSSPILNIGFPSTTQTVKEDEIAEGLTYFKISIKDQNGFYTLSSQLLSSTEADKLTAQLKALNVVSISNSNQNNVLTRVMVPETDPNGISLGELVQYGRYDSILKAKSLQKKLSDLGVKLGVSHTSYMAGQGGPFEVGILKLSKQNYKGQFISALANNNVANAEKTSIIAKNKKAIAAVNAGFFVHRSNLGVLGDPAGISVIDGELVSEAVVGRPALLIKNHPKLSVDILENVTTQLTIKLGGTQYLLNGINRGIGKILNCGQQLEQQSIQAAHDYLCENLNEVIVYNHLAGDLSVFDKEDDFSFYIDDKNNIYGVEEPLGTKVPKGHHLLRAIGNKAPLFKKLVKENAQAIIKVKVQSSSGILNLEKGMYLVNGGPTLLINGKEDISVRSQEGWGVNENALGKNAEDKKDVVDKEHAYKKSRKGLYYNWVVRRHPRTAIGITKDRDVYIVVVYGRNPEISVGASITEMSNIMKGLGVDKAINLDGGGSSIMIINDIRTGVPSDAGGERSVGDALLFLSK